ncbi:MAG: HAMP domain-containing sensor histidine kinase [Acidimicrobiales bacterium]
MPKPEDRPSGATEAALQQALAAAQEAEARSRRFLADAAHQLRNPIAGVHACGEALLHGPNPTDRDRLLGELLRETTRARRLLASLLQMARLDQGQGVTPAECDIVGLCREEADRMWVLAPHLDVVLRVDLAGRQPQVDAGAVREALANILDNGRRHAATSITMTVTAAEEWLEIQVADDGPGMTPEVAERAFQRFVSLDGKGGSGLGLPIALGLARAHGGNLTYDHRAFVLRLSLRPEPDPPAAEG